MRPSAKHLGLRNVETEQFVVSILDRLLCIDTPMSCNLPSFGKTKPIFFNEYTDMCAMASA
jgi:hypothetical protein